MEVCSCAFDRAMSCRIMVMSSSLLPLVLSICTDGRIVTGGTMMSDSSRFSGRPASSLIQISGRSSEGMRLKRSRTTCGVRSSYGGDGGNCITQALSTKLRISPSYLQQLSKDAFSAASSSSVQRFAGMMCSYNSCWGSRRTIRMEAVPGIFFTSPLTLWLRETERRNRTRRGSR